MSDYRRIDLLQCHLTINHDIAHLRSNMRLAANLEMELVDFDKQIDEALGTLEPLVQRLASMACLPLDGAPVTDEEFDLILAAAGTIGGLSHCLETTFGVYRQVQQAIGQLDYLVSEGKGVDRLFVVADPALADNPVARNLIAHAAASTGGVLAARQCFALCSSALKRLDYQAAARHLSEARRFASNENLLASLVKRGGLRAAEGLPACA